MSQNTFLGLFWLTGSYIAHGMRMSSHPCFMCLLPLPWVRMVVHALTKVTACSPTLSHITSMNMMTIFHGFVARVRGTPPSRHHHQNMAVTVVAAAAAASAAASLLLGNNHPNNDHEAAMRSAISSALQVADVQQRQWGGMATSAARGGDDNGNNDIPFHCRGSPGRIPQPVASKSVRWRGGRIGAIIGIESRTVRLSVLLSTCSREQAVPRWGGQWRLPARWSSSIGHGNEHHVVMIVVLHNNQHKRKEVKWWHDGSPDGVVHA